MIRAQTHRYAWSLSLLLAVACNRGTAELPADEGCDTVTPILDPLGDLTGFESCDGATNRAEAVDANPTIAIESCRGDEDTQTCNVNVDCSNPHGKCVHQDYSFSDYSWCVCAYACSDDSDCGADEACVPAAASEDLNWSQCVAASCRTGADCPSSQCGLSEWEDLCERTSEVALVCRDADDDCRTDWDCDADHQCIAYKDKWGCRPQDTCL